MMVKTILYHPKFVAEFRGLDAILQERAIKIEKLFHSNPLHPSLRLHPLKGRLKGSWSISVTMKVRIIFMRLEDGSVVFFSIGHHDIYRAW